MHSEIAKVSLDQIKQRRAEGDCPITPAYSVEMLEELVVHFASSRIPHFRDERGDQPGLTDAEQKAQGARCGCHGADDYCVCQNVTDATTRAGRGHLLR